MPKNLSGECQVKIQNMFWLKTCRVKCKKNMSESEFVSDKMSENVPGNVPTHVT